MLKLESLERNSHLGELTDELGGEEVDALTTVSYSGRFVPHLSMSPSASATTRKPGTKSGGCNSLNGSSSISKDQHRGSNSNTLNGSQKSLNGSKRNSRTALDSFDQDEDSCCERHDADGGKGLGGGGVGGRIGMSSIRQQPLPLQTESNFFDEHDNTSMETLSQVQQRRSLYLDQKYLNRPSSAAGSTRRNKLGSRSGGGGKEREGGDGRSDVGREGARESEMRGQGQDQGRDVDRDRGRRNNHSSSSSSSNNSSSSSSSILSVHSPRQLNSSRPQSAVGATVGAFSSLSAAGVAGHSAPFRVSIQSSSASHTVDSNSFLTAQPLTTPRNAAVSFDDIDNVTGTRSTASAKPGERVNVEATVSIDRSASLLRPKPTSPSATLNSPDPSSSPSQEDEAGRSNTPLAYASNCESIWSGDHGDTGLTDRLTDRPTDRQVTDFSADVDEIGGDILDDVAYLQRNIQTQKARLVLGVSSTSTTSSTSSSSAVLTGQAVFPRLTRGSSGPVGLLPHSIVHRDLTIRGGGINSYKGNSSNSTRHSGSSSRAADASYREYHEYSSDDNDDEDEDDDDEDIAIEHGARHRLMSRSVVVSGLSPPLLLLLLYPPLLYPSPTYHIPLPSFYIPLPLIISLSP